MSLAAEGAVESAPHSDATRDFWLPWTFRRVLDLPGPPLAIGAAAGRLPGLLAYEARIEGVAESLFDAQSTGRMVLYLLIPLGSWVGGALIEHVVDAVLD